MQHLKPLPREGLTTKVYQQLRQDISAGVLAPGQPLKLREIAAALNVSLTPVREALGQLVSEGVLVQDGHRSVQVPQLDAGTYREIAQLRVQLEGYAAEQAAARATPEEIKALEAIHRRMSEAKRSGDSAGLRLANRDFHLAACQLAGMPLLTRFVENLWLMIGPALRALGQHPLPYRPTQHPHRSYLHGLKTRDGAMARNALTEDILLNAEALLPFLPPSRKAASLPASMTVPAEAAPAAARPARATPSPSASKPAPGSGKTPRRSRTSPKD